MFTHLNTPNKVKTGAGQTQEITREKVVCAHLSHNQTHTPKPCVRAPPPVNAHCCLGYCVSQLQHHHIYIYTIRCWSGSPTTSSSTSRPCWCARKLWGRWVSETWLAPPRWVGIFENTSLNEIVFWRRSGIVIVDNEGSMTRKQVAVLQ